MSALKKENLFSEGTTVRILTFEVKMANGEMFPMAINIQKIKEIVDPSEVPVQGLTPNYRPLIGLINLRHLTIPLLDITHFLGASKPLEELSLQGKRIIVCEFQRLCLGIVVDCIHKIRQFDNTLIQPVPEVLSSFPGNIFNGVLEDNKRFIKMLDIEYVLTQLNVDVAPDAQVEKKPETEISGKTILLVEDSKLFQKKLLGFFSKRGANVVLANDGEEGIRKLKQLDGQVDLIFTDIEMPILNGIGMVRKIREVEEWSDLPVVFNTSISNQGLVDDIVSEGLGHYIVKFDEPHIIRVLDKVFKT